MSVHISWRNAVLQAMCMSIVHSVLIELDLTNNIQLGPALKYPNRRDLKLLNEIVNEQEAIWLKDSVPPFNPSPILFCTRI